ncbi:DUF421 domain-containing protein [Lacicoccus qingdaonensis]|uniref:Uncharacterized membrane protein YcaP, DUF421 family n=1 Tax=Lacicoccus qingdaonensis TaxID=576118 RepID=A0A1G9EKH5_9BACL|nr:DUF421 domain-containing protein [Salinicoccus qingdaonensis]SDK76660.1 Uncharacterized membrane protein YcaP, DUF421 family [Salinicoccus qingdaonensis]
MDVVTEYLHMASKLIVGLIGVIIVIRLLGKKEMAQVTLLDFVYALVLGGVIKDAMYDPTVTIPNMIFVLAIWSVLIYLFEKVTQKSGAIRHVVKGKPVTLIKEGKLLYHKMENLNLEIEELGQLLRVEGIFSLREVNYVMFENSGQLTVLKKQSEQNQPLDTPSYTLIGDGKVIGYQLEELDRDKNWLESALAGIGKQIGDIYYAEWNYEKGWHIQDYDGRMYDFDE